MGRQGPCFHCGIKQTPLWRLGPPEKPVLCNACGSRWRIRGTLDDYLPKHGGGNTKHPPYSKGKEAISQQSSASFEDHANERVFDSLRESEWNPKIHKRKRSELQQSILTPIGRLHRQLLEFLHEEKCSKSPTIEESPLIYYNSNWMMDPNETRLGAVLLDPPQKTEKAEASSDKNNLPK